MCTYEPLAGVETKKLGKHEMSKIKQLSVLTLVLAGFSILALILSHLALTDISHGEEDLTLEWSVLRIAALVILGFIISTILTLKNVLTKTI